MRKILLVEDEQVLRDAFTMILSIEPYLVDTAANGKEALEKCQKQKYDLVLLDIMMPVMDGVTFLQEMNKLGLPVPRVIVLSNLSSGKQIDQALSLGAERNILKSSLSPKQLLTTVRYEIEAV